MKKQSNKISKSRLTLLLRVVLTIAFVMVLDCSTGSPIVSGDKGSGTGVGNGAVIVGKVINPDSQPVRNALVRLRTDSYLADTSGWCTNNRSDTMATVHTDENGAFVIDSVRFRKSYSIEVLDTTCECPLGVIYNVNVGSDTLSDTVRLPQIVVRPVKEINGTIVINGLPQNAYVQIYGMERVGRTDSTGRFEIQQLPVPHYCERNECEYKVKISVIQCNNTVKIFNSELKAEIDNNQNVIKVEFELEDN